MTDEKTLPMRVASVSVTIGPGEVAPGWQAIIDRYKQVFRTLPCSYVDGNEHFYEQAARNLAFLNGRKPTYFEMTAESHPDYTPINSEIHKRTFSSNKYEPASRGETANELAKIKRLALDLLGAIETAHKPARDKLGESLTWKISPYQYLASMIFCADRADLSDVPMKRGPKIKATPAHIAYRAAEMYRIVTGTNPTVRVDADTGQAYGPFLDLLAVVFEVTGVDAPVEYQGRQACRRYVADMEAAAARTKAHQEAVMETIRLQESVLNPLDRA